MAADFRARVIEVLGRLQPGDVVSYGDVAAEAGYAGAARGVGAVLAASEGLPWWRVVMASGRLAPGKEVEQARRLRAEGIRVVGGRIARQARQPPGSVPAYGQPRRRSAADPGGETR